MISSREDATGCVQRRRRGVPAPAFRLIGVARREQAHEGFLRIARDSIGSRAVARIRRYPTRCSRTCGSCRERLTITGSTTTSSGALAELNERAGQPLARVFYLSTAPQFFSLIAAKLGAAGLNRHRAGLPASP
jgi:glucose-6-phosphate 1-dehydrogenase